MGLSIVLANIHPLEHGISFCGCNRLTARAAIKTSQVLLASLQGTRRHHALKHAAKDTSEMNICLFGLSSAKEGPEETAGLVVPNLGEAQAATPAKHMYTSGYFRSKSKELTEKVTYKHMCCVVNLWLHNQTPSPSTHVS